MKIYILILFILMFSLGCLQPKTNKETRLLKKDTSNNSTKRPAVKTLAAKTQTGSIQDEYPTWIDTLVSSYIRQTSNPLVKNALEEKLNEEWVLDQVERTDTATYWVFNVGHDITDEGNTNARYISDSWVIVDSLTRKLYEQDLKSEKIIEWKK